MKAYVTQPKKVKDKTRMIILTEFVLFPWAPGCPHRDAAARWVMHHWTLRHQTIKQLTTGEDLGDGVWSKGSHVNRLVAQAPHDSILIISDVDVWVRPIAIHAAVEAITLGAPWAVPYGDVYRLTQCVTGYALATGKIPTPSPDSLVGIDVDETPSPGHPGGGIVVLRQTAARAVPMDPRFHGWGQEDDSWALALTTVLGRPWRGRSPLTHLWHPPAVRLNRRDGNESGVALYRRYVRARGDRRSMLMLLDEIDRAT